MSQTSSTSPVTSEQRSFADERGHVWRFRLDVFLAEQLLEDLGVNVYDAPNPESDFWKIFGDSPKKLCQSMCIVLGDQLEKLSLSDDEKDRCEPLEKTFMRRLTGESLTRARVAFQWAVIDFFPEPVRTGMKEVYDKELSLTGKVQTAAMEKARMVLNSPKLESETLQKLDSEFSSLLESVGWNPGDFQSDN